MWGSTGIGCIINGAGLAMAHEDMINQRWSAGQLSMSGGGASPERVAAAFRLVLSDSKSGPFW